jgi:hypothetical protein
MFAKVVILGRINPIAVRLQGNGMAGRYSKDAYI